MPDLSVLEINGVPYDLRDPTKAPAGYGYGETLKGFYGTYEANLEGDFDAELATMADKQTKQIAFSCSKELATGATFFGTLIRNTSEYAVLFGYSADNACVFKAKGGGVWTPFEWVNPPMVNGVEYRTTERWQGKAVYTKLIDCGKMPNNTQVAIPHGISMDKVIRHCGYGGTSTIPYSTTVWTPTATTHSVDVAVSTYAIYIRTNYDASAESAMIQLWYTKD